MKYTVYLGTNSMRGSLGLYHGVLEGENLTVLDTVPCLNGDYLALSPDGQSLYAGHEVVYMDGLPTAAVSAYRIGSEGELYFLNRQPVAGQMNCFCSVSLDGKRLYSASYMAGNVTVNPICADGSLEAYTQVLQQPARPGRHWPSAHSVYETPDGRYVLVTNVGLDGVFLYSTGQWEFVWETPVEGRPRQAALSQRFFYVSTEAGGEVFVLRYAPEQREKLTCIQRISTTKPGFSGHAETAGIKLSPSGRMLLVANRAAELNSLAVFQVDQARGTLTRTGHVPVDGIFPRDFDFTPDGRYVLAGLQFSDELELFEVDEARGRLIRRRKYPLPCCSCVRFAKGVAV